MVLTNMILTNMILTNMAETNLVLTYMLHDKQGLARSLGLTFNLVFQESYNGNRERSLEDKSPRHPYDGVAKKARSSFESQPQVFSGPAGGGDPYGLFLYQTMQAAAAMAGGGKGQVHPAALAALSNYQAIKVQISKSFSSFENMLGLD